MTMNKQTIFAMAIALTLIGGVALLGIRDGTHTGGPDQTQKRI